MIFVLFTLIMFHGLVGQCLSQMVSYPERFETVDKDRANAAGRIPLYSPSICRMHELFYPGDQADDWICDCEPGSVYYPESDACYPVFRQGPCNASQILVLPKSAIIPICVRNDCQEDGKVMIKKNCYEIGKSDPCPNSELSYVLGVEPVSLKLDCVKVSVAVFNRMGLDEVAPTPPPYDVNTIQQCPRGCKRAQKAICTPTVERT